MVLRIQREKSAFILLGTVKHECFAKCTENGRNKTKHLFYPQWTRPIFIVPFKSKRNAREKFEFSKWNVYFENVDFRCTQNSHVFCLLLLMRNHFPFISLQVYPGRDITNIVESSHYQKIGGWCRQGALNSAKCKGAQRWVKPFRCLGKWSSKINKQTNKQNLFKAVLST